MARFIKISLHRKNVDFASEINVFPVENAIFLRFYDAAHHKKRKKIAFSPRLRRGPGCFATGERASSLYARAAPAPAEPSRDAGYARVAPGRARRDVVARDAPKRIAGPARRPRPRPEQRAHESKKYPISEPAPAPAR